MASETHAGDPQDLEGVWCVIPVHNNRQTVRKVAMECRSILPHVLVVDDGSTDADVASLFRDTDIQVLRHETNRGKGSAILSGLRYAQSRSGRTLITLDGDGQHFPQDILKFLPLLRGEAPCIVVGHRDFSAPEVPRKSAFGRSFSNFWLRLETGVDLPDSQSGFRAYPVEALAKMKFFSRHYDFEMEVLARASWAGLGLKSVDIGVWYPVQGERTSSFRLFKDNVLISLAHARLIARRLLPIPHRKLYRRRKVSPSLLQHPRAFMLALLKEHATPAGLAVAAGIGSFLSLLPIVGFHSLAILYVSTRLNLNKVMAFSIQNLYMPPFGPMACIQLGYLIRHGHWLMEGSWEVLVRQIHQRLFDWLIGSLFLAPLMAVIAGGGVYWLARKLSHADSENGTLHDRAVRSAAPRE